MPSLHGPAVHNINIMTIVVLSCYFVVLKPFKTHLSSAATLKLGTVVYSNATYTTLQV